MTEVNKISKNVAIVDDDPAIRRSLKWLVESIGLVVETFESAQAFLDSEVRSNFGCLILDMRMPGMSGLDLLENRPEDVKMPVIVITGYGEVPTAVRAMKAGAFDFIEKPFNDQMLIDRVNQALDTHSRESASFSRRYEILERLKSLTPRETEVVELIVQGLPNKQIAVKLGLSEKTVEVHRARVMHKMKAENVATLVRIVLTATQGDVPPQYTPS